MNEATLPIGLFLPIPGKDIGNYTCCVCENVPLRPFVNCSLKPFVKEEKPCEHIVCDRCKVQWMAKRKHLQEESDALGAENIFSCPVCRNEAPAAEWGVHPKLMATVATWPVHCAQCAKDMTAAKYVGAHTCAAKNTCAECGAMMAAAELEHHKDAECPEGFVKCECGARIRRKHKDDHECRDVLFQTIGEIMRAGLIGSLMQSRTRDRDDSDDDEPRRARVRADTAGPTTWSLVPGSQSGAPASTVFATSFAGKNFVRYVQGPTPGIGIEIFRPDSDRPVFTQVHWETDGSTAPRVFPSQGGGNVAVVSGNMVTVFRWHPVSEPSFQISIDSPPRTEELDPTGGPVESIVWSGDESAWWAIRGAKLHLHGTKRGTITVPAAVKFASFSPDDRFCLLFMKSGRVELMRPEGGGSVGLIESGFPVDDIRVAWAPAPPAEERRMHSVAYCAGGRHNIVDIADDGVSASIARNDVQELNIRDVAWFSNEVVVLLSAPLRDRKSFIVYLGHNSEVALKAITSIKIANDQGFIRNIFLSDSRQLVADSCPLGGHQIAFYQFNEVAR